MKRSRQQSGHAVLELAFSAAVMMSCLGGAFEFGYTFHIYNQLLTAVGNGGRYAAMRTYRCATANDIEKGRTAIRNMVVYGDPQPAADAIPVVAGLTPEQVGVTWVPGDFGDAPEAVDIKITHFPIEAAFGVVALDGRPAVEFPFVGRFAPAEQEP